MTRWRDLEREPSLDESVRGFVPYDRFGELRLPRDPGDLTTEQSWHLDADGTIVDSQTDIGLEHSRKIALPSDSSCDEVSPGDAV